MCENLRKSEQMVKDVADTIAIDYAQELKSLGFTKEQIRAEVIKYIGTPQFLDAVKRKVEEYIAMFDEPDKTQLH